jgi:precorrin-8X/cobalt-precorrin-8 methylmutase
VRQPELRQPSIGFDEGWFVRQEQATLFDAYIFVDWSASSRPKRGRDSIWAADGWFMRSRMESGDVVLANLHTRCEAERWLVRRIRLHREAGRRVLVGFDFPFGYPEGSLRRLFPGNGYSWRTLWQHLEQAVRDGERNENNRFEVAKAINRLVGERWYWGCPQKSSHDCLAPTKQGRGLAPEYRLVEMMLRATGRQPFSVWQLLGAGAVGSQALVGLPVCERLVASVESLAVWPFQTGLRCPARGDGAGVVLCEIWPGVLEVAGGEHPVRDAAQVLSYVRAAAARDARGELSEWFEVPALPASDRGMVESEGWILAFVPSFSQVQAMHSRAARPCRNPRTART